VDKRQADALAWLEMEWGEGGPSRRRFAFLHETRTLRGHLTGAEQAALQSLHGRRYDAIAVAYPLLVGAGR
jgi:hypothetical protein